MNSFAIVAFFACLAAAYAAPSEVLQGPSSRSTVVGPDGSAISAVAPGGQVVHETSPGVVAAAAPVLPAAPVVAAYSAIPAVAPAVAAYSAHAVAPAVAAYSAHGVAPAVAAYSAPVVAHAGYVAPAARVVVPSGHGLEGQYVHDYTETLYDDGSYKPHVY